MGERVFELVFLSPFGTAADGAGPDRDETFDRIYREAVMPACEQQNWWPDRPLAPSWEANLALVLRADVAIADVTLSNPTVFYELGLRHSVAGGATMLTADEDAVLPHGIDQYPVIRYDRTRLDALRDKIIAELDRFERGERPGSPIRDELVRAGLATSAADHVAFEQEFNGRLERATDAAQLRILWRWARRESAFGVQQMLALAGRLYAEQQWKTVAEVLGRAVGEASSNLMCHRMYADALLRLNELGPAEDQIRAALALDPGDRESLDILGNILSRLPERRGEARNVFLKLHELVLSDDSALVKLGRLELVDSSAEHEKGLERYKELEERLGRKPPGTRHLWDEIIRAEALFVTGRDDDAFRSYDRAIAHPQNGGWQIRDAIGQLKQFASQNFRADAANRLIARVEAAQGRTFRGTEQTRVSRGNPILIHLSDLHFGYQEKPDGTKERMHRFSRDGKGTLLEYLKREFSPSSRKRRFSFDPERVHVVISGDITYRGEEDEFNWANEFLVGLCKELGIDEARERVIIVPGNHDVNWKAARFKDGMRFYEYLSFLEKFYGLDRVRKLYPNGPWARERTKEETAPSDIFSIHASEDRQFQIVGMNTCVHENPDNHWGFLSDDQRQNIGEHLEGTNPKPVRIAVLHHHLHPHPERQLEEDELPRVDGSLLRDGGLSEAWLQANGFDVVLHGHKHRPQLRETSVRGALRIPRNEDRSLIVCGAGSAGVQRQELDHNTPNQYQVLEICVPRIPKATFLSLTWRELEVDSSEWTSGQAPWVLQG